MARSPRGQGSLRELDCDANFAHAARRTGTCRAAHSAPRREAAHARPGRLAVLLTAGLKLSELPGARRAVAPGSTASQVAPGQPTDAGVPAPWLTLHGCPDPKYAALPGPNGLRGWWLRFCLGSELLQPNRMALQDFEAAGVLRICDGTGAERSIAESGLVLATLYKLYMQARGHWLRTVPSCLQMSLCTGHQAAHGPDRHCMCSSAARCAHNSWQASAARQDRH